MKGVTSIFVDKSMLNDVAWAAWASAAVASLAASSVSFIIRSVSSTARASSLTEPLISFEESCTTG